MNGKGRASISLALKSDAPAMPFDDLFDERKAQARADNFGLHITLQTIKLLEDARLKLLWYSVALVTHIETDMAVVAEGDYLHIGTCGAVLDGVVQEIVDGLREKLLI